jgi:hypothetical protein
VKAIADIGATSAAIIARAPFNFQRALGLGLYRVHRANFGAPLGAPLNYSGDIETCNRSSPL